MHWYGGSIAEAVTLSKQKNAIFVVFVEGDNELSTEMAAIIDNASVVSRLSNQTNFLAIKLKSGTPNYTHFAQIYQFVPVPSLFFIGRNGTPLEVVCGGVQPDNLAVRIDRILQQHYNDKSQTGSQPSSSTSRGVLDASINLIQAEMAAGAPPSSASETPSPPKIAKTLPVTKEADSKPATSAEYEVVCDGDVCERRPRAADQPSTSQAPVAAGPDTLADKPPTVAVGPGTVANSAKPPSTVPVVPASAGAAAATVTGAEEKLGRAQELLEATRREKAEKEKELEKQKELERRNTGQGVAELKKWQADQEMKQLQEDRKREKLENNLARQRILEQIAQDRAERRARDAPAQPAPPQAAPHVAPLPTIGDAGATARVQFKMPDGTSHTAHFQAGDTLRRVQDYVADNLQMSSPSFSLWTAFPRRELTSPAATLRELQLAPSAALLVLPTTTATPTSGPTHFSIITFITQLLSTYLYEPSLVLVAWIRSRVFPPPAVAPRPPSVPATPAPTAPTTGPLPRAGQMPRRRTNIHRLPGDAANDDDNNTWNGNSTQQM